MASLTAELFRRKPVVEMEAESGSETEQSELSRSIGLFQLAMFGVGATVGTGIFFGHSLYDTGAMLISATSSGAAYAAVRLRIGTIWPLALLHGLENFCNTRSPGDAPWWYLTEAIFYVLYTAWLLRRLRPS